MPHFKTFCLATLLATSTLSACSQEKDKSSGPIGPTSSKATTATAAAPNTAPTTTLPATATAKSGASLGSCSFFGVSCADYEGVPSNQPKEMCSKYSGKWSDSPCPKAGIVGTCISNEGGVRILTHSYPPGTAETSKKACANTPGGQFVGK